MSGDETAAVDSRSDSGETVAVIDAAIVTLRLASRRLDGVPPDVAEALRDLWADAEVQHLLSVARGLSA